MMLPYTPKLGILLGIYLVLKSTSLVGQCPTKSIVLFGQHDIDNFPSNYPGCSIIDSSITVAGRITSLDSLYQIEKIHGSLEFNGNSNTSLENFEGLNNLQAIGGNLLIRNNGIFKTFRGLNNLEYIGGDLDLQHTIIKSLSDLNSLRMIGGSLTLDGNHNIDSFSLPTLQHIGVNLNLYSNDSLINPGYYPKLKEIGGCLIIEANQSIENLSGLDSLESVIQHVKIQSNYPFTFGSSGGLKSLHGLESLNFVGGKLYN